MKPIRREFELAAPADARAVFQLDFTDLKAFGRAGDPRPDGAVV